MIFNTVCGVYAPPPAVFKRIRRLLAEERVRERLGVEWREVVGLLPQSDVPNGQAEIAADGERDAALGGAVELRQHDAGDAQRLVEDPRLRQRVLAAGRVDHQQHLVGRVRHQLRGGARDLLHLFHEVRLHVETPGGVDDDDVGLARDRRLDAVERHRRRIGPVLVLHDVGADPLGPCRELFDGGGAKGVAGDQDDGALRKDGGFCWTSRASRRGRCPSGAR
jgi:hypothetical protein